MTKAYMVTLGLCEGRGQFCLHPGVPEGPPAHLPWLDVHHATPAHCCWRCYHQVLHLKYHVLRTHMKQIVL